MRKHYFIFIAMLVAMLLIASVSCGGVQLTATPTPSPILTSMPTPPLTPPLTPPAIGPDVQTKLVLRADRSQLPPESADAAVNEAKKRIEQRIEDYGVTGASVVRQDAGIILVYLPEVENIDNLIELITARGNLDFREMVYDSYGNPVLDGDGNPEWKLAMAIDSSGKEVQLTGQYLQKNSQVLLNQFTNQPEVSFEFNNEGAYLFAQITGRLIGKELGVFRDDKLLIAPIVKVILDSGKGVITGVSLDEARNLAIMLNSGALPVPVELVSIDT